MATVLLAALIALLIGHAVPDLVRLRDFGWYQNWVCWCGDRSQARGLLPGQWWLLLSILVPVLLLGLLQWSARGQWWGLPSFVLATLVLTYCWGPRDLDADVDAIGLAGDASSRQQALQSLPDEPPEPALEVTPTVLVDQVFLAGLSRWFGVLFWFFVLGAAGALAYRLLRLALATESCRQHLSAPQVESIRALARLLDWPVAQLMTVALALAADFDAVVGAWRDFHGQGPVDSPAFDPGYLLAAARASVDLEPGSDADADLQETAVAAAQQALALIWRILVVWLAAVSLLVLAGKIG